ncbi:ABC transporter substrate-binding protein [Bacteroidota bacterium]
MRLLIGIDDTDNKESRGTGYNSRQLAAAIEAENLGKVHGITRHQLFVHPDIPYTSQNSSACLDVTTNNFNEFKSFCRTFMLNIGAVGSDVGLCILGRDRVPVEIIKWGMDAKSIVLKMDNAIDKAERNEIYLEGLSGTKDGIIGALAAVGLRAGGNDGRFIWLNSKKNLRNIEHGIETIEDLIKESGIDLIESIGNNIVNQKDKVYLNDLFCKIINNKSVLLVEKITNNNNYEWKCTDKEFVKKVSN